MFPFDTFHVLHHRPSVPALISNERGGYDFLEGIEPYSSGVVARERFEVVHVALDKLLPWRDGFARVEEYCMDHSIQNRMQNRKTYSTNTLSEYFHEIS